jgi:hypothetical protein
MDNIIILEELLNNHFKIINEAVENAKKTQIPFGGFFHVKSPKLIGSGIRFIGDGGFGCVFSPPTLITPIIKQEYPTEEQININEYDDNYVAKILSCEKNAYKKEFASNMLIERFDKDGNYTPKMIFAGYMDSAELHNSIEKKNRDLYECLKKKLPKTKYKHDYYGYIITTRVGKSLDKLTNDDINKSNIKDVLQSFSRGIRNFINKLYGEEYLHGDIKTPNMTIKDNNIYFIDFGLTDKYNNTLLDKNNNKHPIVLINTTNLNYPIILHFFFKVYIDQFDTFTTNKQEYLKLFNNYIIQPVSKFTVYSDVMNNLITSHKYSIFTNIEEVQKYLNTYIEQLLTKNLDDNSEYSIKEVYEKCFLSIAKNVDIYSLSLAMFHLFYNNYYNPKFTLRNLVSDEILELISELFKDALYNKIKDPNDLADRLDNIIQLI